MNFQLIRMERIRQAGSQPRSVFDEGKIDELAESIRAHGLINPITVSGGDDGIFTIIAGERRFRACKKLGLEEIPAVVKSASMELSLVENVQRENLHPLDEAQALAHLVEITGTTQKEVGERLGKQEDYISQTLSLLRLDAGIQNEWLVNFQDVAKYKTLQVSRVDDIEQQWVAWEQIKTGSTPKPTKRTSGSLKAKDKPLGPRSAFSRMDSVVSACDRIDTQKWKRKTREQLREKVEQAIARLEELHGQLEGSE